MKFEAITISLLHIRINSYHINNSFLYSQSVFNFHDFITSILRKKSIFMVCKENLFCVNLPYSKQKTTTCRTGQTEKLFHIFIPHYLKYSLVSVKWVFSMYRCEITALQPEVVILCMW